MYLWTAVQSATRMFNPSTVAVTDRLSQERNSDKPDGLMSASVLRQILPEQNLRASKSVRAIPVQAKKQEEEKDEGSMIAYPECDDLPELDSEEQNTERPSWDDDFLLKPSAKSRYHLKSH